MSHNPKRISDGAVFASDGAAGDEFGASVAVSGDFVMVGSPWDDVSIAEVAAPLADGASLSFDRFDGMLARSLHAAEGTDGSPSW